MASPSETTLTPTAIPTQSQPTTAILAIPAANATLPPPSDPPPRKFPAPCWTHDETLALITAYQDKWYSLRKRILKTVDWEAVADEVNRLCPDQILPKISAQCRYKMEKLRKRYRAEKQRICNLIGSHGNENRFFGSSWVFFPLIDSMELGPGGSGGGTQNVGSNISNFNENYNNTEISNVDFDVKPFRMNDNTKSDELMSIMNRSRDREFKVSNQNRSRVDYGGDHIKDEGDEYGSGGGGGVKRCSVVGEMVTSIKMLGEGFVKMEKMKMEMMRDIEKMRMEMEMKRREMILDSHLVIVNAFIQGMKKKHKKA